MDLPYYNLILIIEYFFFILKKDIFKDYDYDETNEKINRVINFSFVRRK